VTETLFPTEAELAVLVLGKRAKEWPAKAKFLTDKEGLPPIDPIMGGRFWPAVVEYFRIRQGVRLVDRQLPALAPVASGDMICVPFKPDGRNNFDVEEPLAFDSGGGIGRNRRAGLSHNRSR
jgi:hypothetical protein